MLQFALQAVPVVHALTIPVLLLSFALPFRHYAIAVLPCFVGVAVQVGGNGWCHSAGCLLGWRGVLLLLLLLTLSLLLLLVAPSAKCVSRARD